MTEDEIRCDGSSSFCLFPEDAGPSVQNLTGPNPKGALKPLGVENDPATLDALLEARCWLDAADHVAKSLLLRKNEHAGHKDAPPGFGPADDMLRDHPELIVLLRRQHALELLCDGKPVQAQQYYFFSILGATWLHRRTPLLDKLVSDLGKTLAAAVAAVGEPTNPSLDLPAERRRTCRDVWDYLRVYFPEFDRRAEAAAWMARSRGVLYTAAVFGEVVSEIGKQYRCLVCHQPLSFCNVPDQRLTEHLHDHCPAVTPALRSRLPRANRPPWHAASEAKRRRHK